MPLDSHISHDLTDNVPQWFEATCSQAEVGSLHQGTLEAIDGSCRSDNGRMSKILNLNFHLRTDQRKAYYYIIHTYMLLLNIKNTIGCLTFPPARVSALLVNSLVGSVQGRKISESDCHLLPVHSYLERFGIELPSRESTTSKSISTLATAESTRKPATSQGAFSGKTLKPHESTFSFHPKSHQFQPKTLVLSTILKKKQHKYRKSVDKCAIWTYICPNSSPSLF